MAQELLTIIAHLSKEILSKRNEQDKTSAIAVEGLSTAVNQIDVLMCEFKKVCDYYRTRKNDLIRMKTQAEQFSLERTAQRVALLAEIEAQIKFGIVSNPIIAPPAPKGSVFFDGGFAQGKKEASHDAEKKSEEEQKTLEAKIDEARHEQTRNIFP